MFLNCIHPEDKEYVHREWEKALKGDNYDLNHRIITSDGSVKWIREKADIEFDAQGAAVQAVGFAQDITEQKNHENVLRKKVEELEKMNKVMVGRELKMIELKKNIAHLESKQKDKGIL